MDRLYLFKIVSMKIVSFKKYHWKVINCEVEINVLKLRVAKIY